MKALILLLPDDKPNSTPAKKKNENIDVLQSESKPKKGNVEEDELHDVAEGTNVLLRLTNHYFPPMFLLHSRSRVELGQTPVSWSEGGATP